MKFNWGHGIVLTMLLFVGMMAAFAAWATREQEQLVVEDYYGRELQFQERQQCLRRAKALDEKVHFSVAKGELLIHFPPCAGGMRARGKLLLFRPSDQRADQLLAVEPDSMGRWRHDITGALPGAYKAQLEWEVEGVSYCTEEPIYLP